MPRSGKNNKRTERVSRSNSNLTKIEPLHPQVENLDKHYNDLAKFPSENPYPVLRIHKDGTVLYANKASEPLLKARDSAIGKPAPEEWHRLAKEVLASGRIVRKEVKYDGHVFALRAVPITESDYVNFYGVDITEQKGLEEALKKERQELKLIIDSSPIIVFCKDKEGRFVRVNKAFTKSLNIPEEKFLGKTVFDFYSAKIAQSMTNDDQEVFVSGRAKLNIEEQYESTKGLRWVQTDKVPIFDKDGILVGLVGFAQDITERKRAEDNLRKSEESYRITFENTGTATVLIEEDTTIILANTEFERLSGFSKQEIEGKKKWTEFVAKEDLPWMLEQHHLRRKDKEEAAKQYEFRFVTRTGNIRNISHFTDVIPGTKRSVASLVDITERKQAEERLQEERNLLRTLIDHIPDDIYIKDKNSRFLLYNKAVAEYWRQRGRNDLMGKTDFDLFPQATAQSYFDEERKIMATNQPVIDRERTHPDSKENLRHLLTTKVPLRDTHGNITGIVGVNHDITTIKMFETKLLDYQKQLKRLASRLITVEEQERRRIATDIHDEISQTLAIAKIKLDKLRHSPLPETTSQAIEEATHLVEQVIQETRTLTFELSNPILYELGFEAAVAEWLNDNVQVKHGIATEFHDDELPKPIDDDLKAMLFRNARELLTNCIKHAKAGRIVVSLRRIDDSIEVTVEDNGVGFDPAQLRTTAKKPTFGLFSIRENLEQLCGRFEIKSKPGAGCKAIMTAPLEDQSIKEV